MPYPEPHSASHYVKGPYQPLPPPVPVSILTVVHIERELYQSCRGGYPELCLLGLRQSGLKNENHGMIVDLTVLNIEISWLSGPYWCRPQPWVRSWSCSHCYLPTLGDSCALISLYIPSLITNGLVTILYWARGTAPTSFQWIYIISSNKTSPCGQAIYLPLSRSHHRWSHWPRAHPSLSTFWPLTATDWISL